MVTRHVWDVGVGDPAAESGWLVIGIGDPLGGVGFEGDFVSEGFEFVDESAFAGVGVVDTSGEVVGAQVAVGAGLGEDMPNDHNEGVGGGDGGFLPALFAEASVEPAELGADVGAGAPAGPGALDENRAEFVAALTGPTGAVLAGGFVVPRTQPGPRRQVRRCGEAGHLDADLGDDDLGGALTDPRDRLEQRRLLDEREAGLVDAGVQPGDHVGEVVDVLQMQGAHQRVLIREAPRARPGQIGDLAARQVREHGGVTFTVDQSFDHGPRRDRGQLRGHRVDLDSAVFEDLAQALQLAGARLDELLAVAGQLPDHRDLAGRDETPAQQPTLGQLRQPRRVKGIAFATRDILDMSGVDQQHLQRPLGLAQGMKDRSPIHPGRFHAHVRDTLGDQPSHHLDQRRVVGVELADLLVTLAGALAGGAYRHRDNLFPDVDRGDPLVDQLHLWLPSGRPTRRVDRGTRMNIKSLRLALEKAATRSTQPGRAPASICGTGSTPRQGRTTSAADTPPSFNDPRALRQRHQDLWCSSATTGRFCAGAAEAPRKLPRSPASLGERRLSIAEDRRPGTRSPGCRPSPRGGEVLMTMINGLPAHVLLVHLVVVLIPVSAVLVVLVAAWPAARRRLDVLTAALGVAALVAVPITTDAGEW